MTTSADIRRSLDVPETIHTPMEPTSYPRFEVSIYTDIGGRKHQEDRFTFCPELVKGRDDCAFFGVFDGTVGDFASENVKDLVVPQLVASSPWRKLVAILSKESCSSSSSSSGTATDSSSSSSASSSDETAQRGAPRSDSGGGSGSGSGTGTSKEKEEEAEATTVVPLLKESVNVMYRNADEELIRMCHDLGKDYASSTSVTAIMVKEYIGVGHLGDSRIAMGMLAEEGGGGEGGGVSYQHQSAQAGGASRTMMKYEFLTVDHKPDMPAEKRRIMRNGGSVEYLHNHNNKPFIRGGDFSIRKSRGEQPMQLQYSRAFGGKDLKMFGLSNQPDVRIVKLTPQHRVMILASDGLWDVLTAQQAIDIAMRARSEGRNPAQTLVQLTLREQQSRNQSPDNITAMAVFFK